MVPLSRTRPVWRNSPVTAFSIVLLPEPFGPTTTVTAPAFAAKETSRTIGVPLRLTFSASISKVGVAAMLMR